MPSRRLLTAVAAGVAATALIGSAGALGAGSQTVSCKGGASQCTAKVSLAGGASNKAITVRLTDTNLHLASKSAPNVDKGAYSISKAKYAMGGSIYTFTLNAVGSIPKGTMLTLVFKAN